MSDKKDLEAKVKSSDPELEEILDSALEDFNKVDGKDVKKDEGDQPSGGDDVMPDWTDEFIKQAALQFEANMAKVMGGATGQDPTSIAAAPIEMNLQKMAEAAAQVISNPNMTPTPQSNDFSATITQTLQNLSLGAENLQNPFSEQDLMGMFGGAENENAFLPFMQGMMQSLLSKEVLYPSLKDILEKYPAWLTENKSKISQEDFDRYTKQKDLMQQVCQELEKEADSDAENVKKERFDKVLNLMQKMQDLGQPPSDIVGDMGAPVQFNDQGQPILPEGLDVNNLERMCSIM